MCLDKVLQKPKRLSRRGQKLFEVRLDGLFSPFFRQRATPYPIGEWITDKVRDRVTADFSMKKYRLGFHIYVGDTKHLAPPGNYVFRNVIFRNVLAYGKDRDVKTVVVREMMILPEGK